MHVANHMSSFGRLLPDGGGMAHEPVGETEVSRLDPHRIKVGPHYLTREPIMHNGPLALCNYPAPTCTQSSFGLIIINWKDVGKPEIVNMFFYYLSNRLTFIVAIQYLIKLY